MAHTQTLSQGSVGFKVRTAALWAVQLGLAFIFFQAGGHKLAGDPQMVGLFDAIGFGQWFRYATGLIEVGGAAMLLVPRLAVFGGALLAPTMVGAIATHLLVIGGNFTLPVILLVGSVIVVYARRGQLPRLGK